MNGVRLRRLLINLGLDPNVDGRRHDSYGEAYVRDRADRLLNPGLRRHSAGAGQSLLVDGLRGCPRSLELNSAYMLVGKTVTAAKVASATGSHE